MILDPCTNLANCTELQYVKVEKKYSAESCVQMSTSTPKATCTHKGLDLDGKALNLV